MILKSVNSYDNLTEVSKLIYLANAEFYDIFGKDKDNIINDLSLMVKDERTEEYNTHVIVDNDNLIGIISFYNSDEIYYRQIFSLNYLILESNLNKETLNKFSKSVPKIEDPSIYISRVTISEKFRSKGYLKKIIDYLMDYTIRSDRNIISLHVYYKNERAISAYKKNGFKVINENCNYLIMEKEL